MTPEERLEEAVKQLQIAREDVRRPDRDSALAKAEYLAGGVLRDLEQSDDQDDCGIDPHLVTDGGRDELSIKVRGSDDVATLENALEAVAAEHDAELNSTRGRPSDGQMKRSEALVELARAYTGWDPAEVNDGR